MVDMVLAALTPVNDGEQVVKVMKHAVSEIPMSVSVHCLGVPNHAAGADAVSELLEDLRIDLLVVFGDVPIPLRGGEDPPPRWSVYRVAVAGHALPLSVLPVPSVDHDWWVGGYLQALSVLTDAISALVSPPLKTAQGAQWN